MPTDISEEHAREWLAIFRDGRTLCGVNDTGVWWNEADKVRADGSVYASTHLTGWPQIERDLYEDNLREHCRAAADQERGEDI